MRPNFALSLSHDGIELLQRSAAGWRSIGQADPASSTLDDDLAALRRTATALAPGGLRCKLIIPKDLIRFLTIDTPAQETEERREAARSALDGATPYAVDDLVFDISEDAQRTHVAAVARETLEEAENFACQHFLNPVCFTARPDDGTSFAGEVFFGPTSAARELLEPGEVVEREGTAPPDRNTAQPVAKTPEPAAEEALSEQAEEKGSRPAGLARVSVGQSGSDNFDRSERSGDKPAEGSDSPARDEPGFVSRRQVPTFRAEPDKTKVAAGSVPGFGEQQAAFSRAPEKVAQSPVPQAKPTALPAPAPVVRRPETEAERFTIYGAQRQEVSRPGRSGVSGVLVMLGLVLLAGLGAFAFGASSGGLSGLLARFSAPAEPEIQFTTPAEPVTQSPPPEIAVARPDDEARIELAALEEALTDEDAAVLDALRAPVTGEPEAASDGSPEDLREAYAVTGIWPVAPDVPSPPPLVDLEDLYVTGVDPINQNFDAVALPSLEAQAHDRGFLVPASPAPAGTVFTLDARGMVVPTAQGSLNPDGIAIYAGAPPARPPETLVKLEDPGEDLSVRLRLSGIRPKPRPTDLIETSERAAFSGLTRSELGEIRPRSRPKSEQETALESASLVSIDDTNSRSLLEQPGEGADLDSATARAVIASLRPDARPRDFDRTVARALERAPTPAPAVSAAVTPRVVAPKIPSSASATREATVKNAINMRQLNLIGVYGTPSSRRALVRLGSGEYRKVEVGDRIDGGRVSAIGDAELRYQKSGRSVVLRMPSG